VSGKALNSQAVQFMLLLTQHCHFSGISGNLEMSAKLREIRC